MKVFSPILLCLSLASVLSVSSKWVDPIRSQVLNVTSFVSFPSHEKGSSFEVETSHQLALENQLLQEKVEALYEWLLFDSRIDEQTQTMQKLQEKCDTSQNLYWKEFFQRRSEEEKKILEMQMQSILGKVIYREPASWNSSLWINIGEKDNDALGRLIVSKNSPVLWGPYLVGVVEFVDQDKSRVRLITDSRLIPSVRAVRGEKQDQELINLAHSLLQRVENRKDIDQELKKTLQTSIYTLQASLGKNQDIFLAKGELHGSSDPLWAKKRPLLKGVGFNYHFVDADYPSQDLGQKSLLEQGDLLVTTGLDGVFPAGLPIAIVSKVFPMDQEGSTYELEALPCVSDMNSFSYLYVMPPLRTGFSF